MIESPVFLLSLLLLFFSSVCALPDLAPLAAPLSPDELQRAMSGAPIERATERVRVRAQFLPDRVAMTTRVGPCPHPRMLPLGDGAERCAPAADAATALDALAALEVHVGGPALRNSNITNTNTRKREENDGGLLLG